MEKKVGKEYVLDGENKNIKNSLLKKVLTILCIGVLSLWFSIAIAMIIYGINHFLEISYKDVLGIILVWGMLGVIIISPLWTTYQYNRNFKPLEFVIHKYEFLNCDDVYEPRYLCEIVYLYSTYRWAWYRGDCINKLTKEEIENSLKNGFSDYDCSRCYKTITKDEAMKWFVSMFKELMPDKEEVKIRFRNVDTSVERFTMEEFKKLYIDNKK